MVFLLFKNFQLVWGIIRNADLLRGGWSLFSPHKSPFLQEYGCCFERTQCCFLCLHFSITQFYVTRGSDWLHRRSICSYFSTPSDFYYKPPSLKHTHVHRAFILHLCALSNIHIYTNTQMNALGETFFSDCFLPTVTLVLMNSAIVTEQTCIHW